MQNLSALQELTKKLNEIKESWQIYTIFEAEKKRFNEEFDALKKDKESLMESFNEISAKNALLLADNKELEQRNKSLTNEIAIKEQQLESLNQSHPLAPDTLKSKTLDLAALETQYQNLKKSLESTEKFLKNTSLVRPKALEKLEIYYKKNQRLLANPAKEYVPLESATLLFDTLTKIQSQLKTLLLENSKLESEIQHLQDNSSKSVQTQPNQPPRDSDESSHNS